MANRPTTAQQQLFEHVLEEMSNTAITRSMLRELTPAQRNKVLEIRKLQNILIHAQTSEELTSNFATIKWPLINNPRDILFSSGCADVWSVSPFSWLDPIRPNEISANMRPPWDNTKQPNFEPIWLIHYTVANTNCDKENLNNFINHLVGQGVTGDTQVLSVAFGGVERPLKLHDVVVAYASNTQAFNWDLITKQTTWKTASEVEDTIFSVFLSMDKVVASESEKVLKRLPALKINWGRQFAVNVFQTHINYPISLSTLVCVECLKNPPRTKHIKNLYFNAINAIASCEVNQQIQVIKDVLSLTHGFRHNGGLSSFTDSSKQLLPHLSPPAQKIWASELISEVIVSHPYELSDRVHNILRILPEKKHFDIEHLQLFHKHIARFLKVDYYSGAEAKRRELFKLWKDLRPYMTDQALDVVDALSSDLLGRSTPSDIKDWVANFNLHVNIKPQLLNQVSKTAQRKM